MNKRMQGFRMRARQLGFSIVELMVAILIGLIILAGVIQVVVTSKHTFLGQEEMSFIQENARYAMDVMGKDLQSAGYWGCAGFDADVALVARVEPTAAEFLSVAPLTGYKAGADTANYPEAYGENVLQVGIPAGQGYPDSLIVRRAAGAPISVVSHQGNQFTLAANAPFAVGSYFVAVAEDCRRFGVLRTSALANNGQLVQYSNTSVCGAAVKPALGASIVCNASCECSGGDITFAQLYLPGAMVMEYAAHAYYIADSSALPGTPALKRMVLRGGSGVEEEIALGVEDMHIRYAERNGNSVAYRTADAVQNWGAVVAVEVNLIFRSQTAALSAPETKQIPGSGRVHQDRFMRQVVTSTFRLRNRI